MEKEQELIVDMEGMMQSLGRLEMIMNRFKNETILRAGKWELKEVKAYKELEKNKPEITKK